MFSDGRFEAKRFEAVSDRTVEGFLHVRRPPLVVLVEVMDECLFQPESLHTERTTLLGVGLRVDVLHVIAESELVKEWTRAELAMQHLGAMLVVQVTLIRQVIGDVSASTLAAW